MDSCQESVPYLFVNGVSYNFSDDVLEKGKALFHSFCVLRKTLKTFKIKGVFEMFKKEMEKELKIQLRVFDKLWVEYEEKYIIELMNIENEARKPIIKAIKYIKKIELDEFTQKSKGNLLFEISEKSKNARNKFINILKYLNSVANIEGKGREDRKSVV